MKVRAAALVLALTTTGCGEDEPLAPVVGDLGGTWLASVYEFTDNTTGQLVVDVIARDDATFRILIDSSLNPPGLSAVYGAGSGPTQSFTAVGEVDVFAGTLSVGAGVFQIDHDGDNMTLTNPNAFFSFGPGQGFESTLRIEMARPSP